MGYVYATVEVKDGAVTSRNRILSSNVAEISIMIAYLELQKQCMLSELQKRTIKVKDGEKEQNGN